jgi:hypothetical protein
MRSDYFSSLQSQPALCRTLRRSNKPSQGFCKSPPCDATFNRTFATSFSSSQTTGSSLPPVSFYEIGNRGRRNSDVVTAGTSGTTKKLSDFFASTNCFFLDIGIIAVRIWLAPPVGGGLTEVAIRCTLCYMGVRRAGGLHGCVRPLNNVSLSRP